MIWYVVIWLFTTFSPPHQGDRSIHTHPNDMIWYGMIWYGCSPPSVHPIKVIDQYIHTLMIWYGMTWYDMIWYGCSRPSVRPIKVIVGWINVYHDMAWHDMSMIWCDMIWHDKIWYDTVLHFSHTILWQASLLITPSQTYPPYPLPPLLYSPFSSSPPPKHPTLSSEGDVSRLLDVLGTSVGRININTQVLPPFDLPLSHPPDLSILVHPFDVSISNMPSRSIYPAPSLSITDNPLDQSITHTSSQSLILPITNI